MISPNLIGWLTVSKRKRKKRARPPLDARHFRAIELLARRSTHTSMEDIAAECSVSRRQLYRWMERRDFRSALRKATAEYIDEIRRDMPRISLDGCDAETLRRYFVAAELLRE